MVLNLHSFHQERNTEISIQFTICPQPVLRPSPCPQTPRCPCYSQLVPSRGSGQCCLRHQMSSSLPHFFICTSPIHSFIHSRTQQICARHLPCPRYWSTIYQRCDGEQDILIPILAECTVLQRHTHSKQALTV